MIDLVI